jgi:UDP-N-acetylmuramyl pentapeptide synthase
VGRFAAEQGIKLLISYGALAKEIAAGAAEVGGCEVFTLDADPVAAADLIAEKIENNDILLFKASRAMALEEVIKILKERTV